MYFHVFEELSATQHMYYHSFPKGINMVAIMSYAYIFLNVTHVSN